MEDKQEVQEVEVLSNQVALPADTIKLAIQQGSDLELVKEAMLVQFQWDENEARKAYHRDMAEFKKNAPTIEKDRKVKFSNKAGSVTEYNHASLFNVTNTITEALSSHGFSASWDIKQNGTILVTCKITHKLGHQESTCMSAQKDDTGQKNAIQQIASTISYLERYTLLALTGLSTKEQDDDAKTLGKPVDYINEKQLSQLLDIADNLKDAGSKKTKFLAYIKVESFDKIPADKFTMALNALNASKAKEQNENN